MKTANKNAGRAVQRKECFKGNHTFAENKNKVYKVYSYGYHFPIYACKDGIWYKNKEKYSVSTSKHQSLLYPWQDCIELTTEAMKAL